ncbi:MAG: glycosyltransferase, partial [Dehalococcoidia bacterium]
MRVLVLAPPMGEVGGVQRYTDTLVRALREVVGVENVRVLAVRRGNIGDAETGRLRAWEKGRFAISAMWGAARWRPDLVICTHAGLSPVGWLLHRLWRCRYWVVAYGIEVWGAIPLWKRNALHKADKILAISCFTRDRLIGCHQIATEGIVIMPCVLEDHLLGIVP